MFPTKSVWLVGGAALEKKNHNTAQAGVFDYSPHLSLCSLFLQSLGNSQREYEKHVLLYSIRNQLRFRNNLGKEVKHVKAALNHVLKDTSWV